MSLTVKTTEPEFSSEKRFTLRMDGELYASIAAAAKHNRRSVAKEIQCAIEFYLQSLVDSEDSH